MFCIGFKDKEVDLKNFSNWINLRESLKSNSQILNQFETDCCICFNPFTNEINPVVYCSK